MFNKITLEMKTNLLFVLALAVGVSASAQKMSNNFSKNVDRDAKLEKPRPVDNSTNTKAYNPGYAPYAKSMKSTNGVEETLIGGTVYDTQTNGAVVNRCYVYPDGTVAGVWTMGFTPSSYPERGTGYNYFDGTSWGPEPTVRIENAKTGWPSYRPLGDGEVVVAHNVTTGLLMTKRPVRGTGAWTTTLIPGPAGASDITWPRLLTNGNTMHIIIPSAAAQDGMLYALLYYRSLDGGATWEAPRVLPGLDAASLGAGTTKSFNGFGADNYNWAEPKGDNIAFVVADGLGGIWVMKSPDNGTTWTKVTVQTLPIWDVAPTPIIWSNDGGVSIALDSELNAHVVFGRMRNSDDDFATEGNSYYPVTDGLIYWKEGMPVLDTTAMADWDGLVANGNLIGGMLDYNNNGEIDFPEVGANEFPMGLYGNSLSSFGQITIDESDNIFVTFSACREDLVNAGAAPNAQVYRHLYTTSKMAGQDTWSDQLDLTDDIEHSYDECVAASLAPTTFDGKLHMIYHLDPEPGTAIGSDGDEPSDTYINHLTFPTFVSVKPVDLAKYVEVSPNPARDFSNVVVSLTKADKVELNVYDVMGKLVISNNYGEQLAGYHTYQVNTSDLPSGMYFFTIKVGSSQTSKKVVVE
jgi:hypothetical protein